MDECAPCFFHESKNKLRIRKLPEWEVQMCTIRMNKFIEEFDNSKRQIEFRSIQPAISHKV